MNNTVKDSELNQTIDSLGLFQTKSFRVLIVRCQTARVLRVELVYPVMGNLDGFIKSELPGLSTIRW